MSDICETMMATIGEDNILAPLGKLPIKPTNEAPTVTSSPMPIGSQTKNPSKCFVFFKSLTVVFLFACLFLSI